MNDKLKLYKKKTSLRVLYLLQKEIKKKKIKICSILGRIRIHYSRIRIHVKIKQIRNNFLILHTIFSYIGPKPLVLGMLIQVCWYCYHIQIWFWSIRKCKNIFGIHVIHQKIPGLLNIHNEGCVKILSKSLRQTDGINLADSLTKSNEKIKKIKKR